MLKEFREFVMRGNILELAVAFVMGVAFAAVVQSFVNDVVMNLIAAIFGEPDFSDLTFGIGDGVVAYGAFLTALANFVLVAFALFVILKAAEKAKSLRKTGEEAPAMTRPCPYCVTGIPVEATRCPACTSDLSRAPA